MEHLRHAAHKPSHHAPDMSWHVTNRSCPCNNDYTVQQQQQLAAFAQVELCIAFIVLGRTMADCQELQELGI